MSKKKWLKYHGYAADKKIKRKQRMRLTPFRSSSSKKGGRFDRLFYFGLFANLSI
jgi:hypothetical protein